MITEQQKIHPPPQYNTYNIYNSDDDNDEDDVNSNNQQHTKTILTSNYNEFLQRKLYPTELSMKYNTTEMDEEITKLNNKPHNISNNSNHQLSNHKKYINHNNGNTCYNHDNLCLRASKIYSNKKCIDNKKRLSIHKNENVDYSYVTNIRNRLKSFNLCGLTTTNKNNNNEHIITTNNKPLKNNTTNNCYNTTKQSSINNIIVNNNNSSIGNISNDNTTTNHHTTLLTLDRTNGKTYNNQYYNPFHQMTSSYNNNNNQYIIDNDNNKYSMYNSKNPIFNQNNDKLNYSINNLNIPSTSHHHHNTTNEYSQLLNSRYQIIKILGKGSFGKVFKCFDIIDQRFVALKIIMSDNPASISQSQIEKSILNELNHFDLNSNHIVSLLDDFMWNNHQCLVFELLQMNLYEMLQLTKGKGLDLPAIRTIASKLLRSLSLLYDLDVIHCDLKPENIMVTNSCEGLVKLVDFGSSCKVGGQIYSYIQSRFYRAPEVILELGYSKPIDIWSLGCLLAEMSTCEPLFCGRNEVEQMAHIVHYFGFPPIDMILHSKKSTKFFIIDHTSNSCNFLMDNSINFMGPFSKSLKNYLLKNKSLSDNKLNGLLFRGISGIDDSFENFIFSMLNYDPKKRANPYDLMFHPFIFSVICLQLNITTNNHSTNHMVDPISFRTCVQQYRIKSINNKFSSFSNKTPNYNKLLSNSNLSTQPYYDDLSNTYLFHNHIQNISNSNQQTLSYIHNYNVINQLCQNNTNINTTNDQQCHDSLLCFDPKYPNFYPYQHSTNLSNVNSSTTTNTVNSSLTNKSATITYVTPSITHKTNDIQYYFPFTVNSNNYPLTIATHHQNYHPSLKKHNNQSIVNVDNNKKNVYLSSNLKKISDFTTNLPSNDYSNNKYFFHSNPNIT